MARALFKAAHDRLFAQWVYQVRYGPMQGFQRRGRMPWFQTKPSPQLEAETAFLAGLGLEGAVVYDVGSNIGTHTLFFRRLVGSTGAIHAFEPDPRYRRALLDLVVLNDLENVEIHGCALGDAPTTAELVVPDPRRVRASATLAPELIDLVNEAAVRRTTVRVVRLDDYVRALALPAPDFVKVDVEGFECEVVAGAVETLSDCPSLFVEVHGVGPAAKQARADRLLGQLEDLGYRRFHHVERDVRITVGQPFAGGHVLATS